MQRVTYYRFIMESKPTGHSYDSKVANEIYGRIRDKYADLFKGLLKRLEIS